MFPDGLCQHLWVRVGSILVHHQNLITEKWLTGDLASYKTFLKDLGAEMTLFSIQNPEAKPIPLLTTAMNLFSATAQAPHPNPDVALSKCHNQPHPYSKYGVQNQHHPQFSPKSLFPTPQSSNLFPSFSPSHSPSHSQGFHVRLTHK